MPYHVSSGENKGLAKTNVKNMDRTMQKLQPIGSIKDLRPQNTSCKVQTLTTKDCKGPQTNMPNVGSRNTISFTVFCLQNLIRSTWNWLCHSPWLPDSSTSLAFWRLQWPLFYFRVSFILFAVVVKFFLYIKKAVWRSLLPQHVCKNRSWLIL